MWGTRDSDWWLSLAVILAIGVGLGWVLFIGVPMLWAWTKPFIHAITGS